MRPTLPLALLLLLAVSCTRNGGRSGPASGTLVWGQYRGNDASNRGRIQRSGTADGSVDGSFATGSPVSMPVTIDPFGNLRVKPADSFLRSFSPDGTLLWSTNVGPGAAAPMLDRFGNSFVGTDAGFAVGVSDQGRVLFRRPVGGNLGTGLNYALGSLVFPSTAGQLHFMNTSGELIATLSIGALGEDVVPVMVASRQMMAASVDGKLYEIRIDRETGVPSLGISFALPGPVSRCSPVTDQFHVYVVTDADQLVKAHRDVNDDDDLGSVDWVFDPGTQTTTGGSGTPAIGFAGNIYYGTEDGRMLALRPDGALQWSYAAGAPIRSAPIVDQDDQLFFRTTDGHVHCLDAGGKLRWVRLRGDASSSALDAAPSMDRDGNIYLGTHAGEVIRLSGRPALSQSGANSLHTGQAASHGPTRSHVAWTLQADATVVHQPLVFGNGDLLVPTSAGLAPILGVDGQGVGAVPLGQFFRSIVLSPDSDVVYTTSDGRVVGRTRGGGLLFTRSLLTTGTLSRLTVSHAGLYYVASDQGQLFVVGRGGELVRSFPVARVADSAPTVDGRGRIYLASPDAVLQSYGAGGELRFELSLPGPVSRSMPAVNAQGQVFVATDQDVLVAADPDGQGRWIFDPQESGSDGGRGGPVLTPGGAVVLLTASGRLVGRLAEDGSAVFSLDLGSPAAFAPLADAAGRIHAVTEDGTLHVVAGDGTLLYQAGRMARDDQPPSAALALSGDESLTVVSVGGGVTRFRGRGIWPTFQGSPQHGGRQSPAGPVMGVVRDSTTVAGTLERQPVLSDRGDLLLRTTESDLIVLDAALDVAYQADVGPGPGVPLVHSSGLHLAAAQSGIVSAFQESGGAAWFLALPGPATGLNQLRDGTILVSAGSELIGLTAAGAIDWRTTLGTLGAGAAVVGLDQLIRVITRDGTLWILDQDGIARGAFSLPGSVSRSTPALAADGTLYYTTDGDELVAADRDGALRFRYDPATGSLLGGNAAPAVAADGTILFGAMDGFLYGVHPDGSERFAFDTGGAVQCPPILDGSGMVYVGTDAGDLLGVSLDGAEVFRLPLGAAVTAVVLDGTGELLATTAAGGVFRVGDP